MDLIEMWLPIIGNERHMVSDAGNVMGAKGFALKPQDNGRGYFHTTLTDRKKHYIHRLVAKAFIPNPLNKPQVNHKNGIKSDNRAVNLEWVDNGENQLHAYSTGIKKVRDLTGTNNPRYSHGRKVIVNEPKNCLQCGNEFVAKYPSTTFCSFLCSGRNKVAKMNKTKSERNYQ